MRSNSFNTSIGFNKSPISFLRQFFTSLFISIAFSNATTNWDFCYRKMIEKCELNFGESNTYVRRYHLTPSCDSWYVQFSELVCSVNTFGSRGWLFSPYRWSLYNADTFSLFDTIRQFACGNSFFVCTTIAGPENAWCSEISSVRQVKHMRMTKS